MIRRRKMSVIKDLQTDENGWFADGKFNSTSLFKGEMAVSIFIDDGATGEDAEKCIAHYNSLNNNIDMLLKLQEYLVRFFLFHILFRHLSADKHTVLVRKDIQ